MKTENELITKSERVKTKVRQRLHAYAWKSTPYACHIKSSPRLSNSVTLRRGKLISSTHRRRKSRIGVVDQQAHTRPHICVTLTKPSLNHPRIGVEDPRICVEGILTASNHAAEVVHA
ncbi:hypothetical protein PIB30_099343 [Stylosanthes scabra]|uniref:Uncharacterized protein n=1 Tax=Stylosanthes scabra TaxID=79078 RepID=A0ABU6WV09_9FABA|nr:hypothetical protein [Stylosanthes scabra]